MRGLLRYARPLQAWTDLADKTTSQFPASNDCEVTGRPPFPRCGEFVIWGRPDRQKVEMSDRATRPDHSNSFASLMMNRLVVFSALAIAVAAPAAGAQRSSLCQSDPHPRAAGSRREWKPTTRAISTMVERMKLAC